MIKRLLRYKYQLIIASLLLLYFSVLEAVHPYYFLQDDNRTQFLPFIVHSVRSLLDGELAMINYHQFGGVEYIATGQNQVLYPFAYFTAVISKIFTGNYFASIDIEIIMHSIIGSLGVFYALRSFKLSEKSSLFCSLIWSLSSYFIYYGNSWVVISGQIAYFPWMIYFSFRMLKELRYKYMFGLVAIRLLHFFIGHPQFFIYSCIFEVLTVIMLMIRLYREDKDYILLLRGILFYVNSYLATLLLSAPLLIPMWKRMQESATRSGKIAWDIFTSGGVLPGKWLSGLLSPEKWNSVTMNSDISFIGILTLFFVIVAFLKSIYDYATKKKDEYTYVVVCSSVLAVIVFLWATNIVSGFIYEVPILNRFRWHFKLVPYLNFFIIGIAAVGFHRFENMLSLTKPIKNIVISMIILLNFVHMGNMYISYPIKSIRVMPDKIPYEESLKDKLDDGRMTSVGFNWRDSYTFKGIGFDYATMWGLYNLAGYDPLISNENQIIALGLNLHAYYNEFSENKQGIGDLEHLRTWGVKWYVAYKLYIDKYGDLPFEKKYIDGERIVYYDAEARPMVYLVGEEHVDKGSDVNLAGYENKEKIPFDIKANTLSFKVNAVKNSKAVINFLYLPGYIAEINGKSVTIQKTASEQMEIALPKGANNISIKFVDRDFVVGCLIFVGVLLMIIITSVVIKLQEKMRKLTL